MLVCTNCTTSGRMGAVKTAGRGVVEVLSPVVEYTVTTGRAVMILICLKGGICDPQMRSGLLLLFQS